MKKSRSAAPRPAELVDLRIGDLLQKEPDGTTRAVLIGFPTDVGVKRNGGRPGASAGPQALRRALYRFTPDPTLTQHADLLRRTCDLGDIATGGDLEADQQTLGERVAAELHQGRWVVVLGGGHETTYGHFLGHVLAGDATESGLTVVNWDAHPDVRPLVDGKGHSGSPFRQALEHPSGLCRHYAVAGLLPQAVAASHLAYLENRRAHVVWGSQLDREAVDELYVSFEGPVLASFDLDAVDAMPGVSAPAASGMAVPLWLHAAHRAGSDPAVRSVDVVELNPIFDGDGQTARLAALTVWWLLRGRAERL